MKTVVSVEKREAKLFSPKRVEVRENESSEKWYEGTAREQKVKIIEYGKS